MPNRRSESRVVLISNPADASLHLVVILLIKILHDIKLHIPPSLRSESIDRVDVADSLERFAHQHETFLLDLDDPATRPCVRLQRMTANRARRRRRLIQQKRDPPVTPAPQP